jgi:hypothetical protein
VCVCIVHWKEKKELHQTMEFRWSNATSQCATSVAFCSAAERGMLIIKIEGEYRNYIFSILQIFYTNINVIYRVNIKELYTFKMTHKTNAAYLELHTYTSR